MADGGNWVPHVLSLSLNEDNKLTIIEGEGEEIEVRLDIICVVILILYDVGRCDL